MRDVDYIKFDCSIVGNENEKEFFKKTTFLTGDFSKRGLEYFVTNKRELFIKYDEKKFKRIPISDIINFFVPMKMPNGYEGVYNFIAKFKIGKLKLIKQITPEGQNDRIFYGVEKVVNENNISKCVK